MGVAWNPGAFPGLLALVTGLSMAALVFSTRPDRSQNRRLALLLALEGLGFGALGIMFLATSKATAAGLVAVDIVSVLARPWVYLAFLATLDSPLVERLDSRPATGILAVGAAVSAASYFPLRDRLVDRVISWEQLYQLDSPGVLGGYTWLSGALGDLALVGLLAVALFGLVVAISVYRRTAPGSARRSTARAYLAAFGVRDTLQAVSLVYFLLLSGGGDPAIVEVAVGTWLPQVASILFTLLLAYGILKTQLFGIDLTIKRGLEKSTVAGVFVAVFFVASEGAQALFADFAGSELLGILAAGALVFLLSPLQRLAQDVADTAMPGVQDTEAYRKHRKMQVYEETLRELLRDGEITDRDRISLDRLRDQMELATETADRLEADVREKMGVAD